MLIPNNPSLVASILRPFIPALTGRGLEDEYRPVERPAPAQVEPPPVSAETQPSLEFKAVVRANLHAAAQHVTLGHKGPSFRECSRPSCRNASNLIPYPVVVEPDVTEAELEAILQRLVSAALEEIAANPVLVQMAPEWGHELALVS